MGNGEKVDEVMGKKMASDTAAYARTLATQRGRNVPLVEQAVTESRSFTEREAIGATPPLIDLIASNVPDLIQKLDGRTIKRFNGASVKLELGNADVRYVEMTLAQQILSAIAHPQIAYLLLTLGTLGLTIELWSPGAVVPGVVGGICLLLAFFIAYLGVGFTNVVVVLLLLAIPPILTNVYVGIRQVDRDTVDAARGMGLSELQIIRRVELPLALPIIFGGIRTASVNVVATATIAPLASIDTLGTPIINANVYGGPGRLAAAILVALLTLAIDIALLAVQKAVTPAGLKLARGEEQQRRFPLLQPRRREQPT